MATAQLLTIREALRLTEKEPEVNRGWLYLPVGQWTLESQGIFFDPDINARPGVDQTPDVIEANNWKLTLDTDLIDQIIFNAKAQKSDATIEELFQAFVYYYTNDAFLKFD